MRLGSWELRALSLAVFSTQSRGLATYGWPLRWVSPHCVLCPPYAGLMSYCTVHILQFICHVAQPVSCSTTFMSRSIMRSTIFDHCVALGGVRLGVSSLRRTCCPLWSTWISLGFLSGSLRALRVCTYTHNHEDPWNQSKTNYLQQPNFNRFINLNNDQLSWKLPSNDAISKNNKPNNVWGDNIKAR
jgi:hypothetical protein